MNLFLRRNQRLFTDAFVITLLTFFLIFVVRVTYRLIEYSIIDRYNLVSGVRYEVEEQTVAFANARLFARPVLSPILPVLVDTDTASRARIGVILDSIARRQPRVVGLDITFAKAGVAADTSLDRVIRQLAKQGKLVRAYDDADRPAPHLTSTNRSLEPARPAGILGFTDFSIRSPQLIVRHFTPWLETDTSFAGRLVSRYDPAAWNRFKKYRSQGDPEEDERILYQPGDVRADTLHERDFRPGNPELAKLRDALVMVGSMAGYRDVYLNEDIHPVPIPPGSLSGLEIHAHIAAMLLNESYPRRSAPVVLYGLSFLLCWGMVVFFLTRHTHPTHHRWAHYIFTATRLLVAILVLAAVSLLIRMGNIEFDPLVFLLPVGLSIEVLYLYEPAARWLHKTVNTQTISGKPVREPTECIIWWLLKYLMWWLTRHIPYHTYFPVDHGH